MTVSADVTASSLPEPPSLPRPPVQAARWPSEVPLFLFSLAASVIIWLALLISIFGALYASFFLALFFVAHLVAITHIRGSGIKLSEDQLPELHRRVQELASAAGIRRVPDAYVMQEGGALNAFATKLFRSRLIVLYSDLLEACGDDENARDMVIGHELGHVKSGHLDWMWVLAPSRIVPFLGTAYSRACELTCDRWGAALCGDRDAAVRGLVILAAGGELSRRIDLAAFVRQQSDLDTGWLTLGRWFSMYPPLCARVAALDETLAEGARPSARGPIRALAILGGGFLCIGLLFGGVMALLMLPAFRAGLGSGSGDPASGLYGDSEDHDPDDYDLENYEPPVADGFEQPADPAAVEAATQTAIRDLERVAAIALRWTRDAGHPPDELEQVEPLWDQLNGPEPFPRDPFDGFFFGYYADETTLHLWSSGPDAQSATDDDIDHAVDWADG